MKECVLMIDLTVLTSREDENSLLTNINSNIHHSSTKYSS
jgi:hypothetical protein